MKSIFKKYGKEFLFNPVRILWLSLAINLILTVLIFSMDFEVLNLKNLHQKFHNNFPELNGWQAALVASYLSSLLLTFIAFVATVIFEQTKRLRLESSLRLAELIFLRAQIQPHFLFNTLNSIKALVRTDARKAEFTLQKLSELYRYILTNSKRDYTSLEEELQHCEQYLSLEKIRFGNRLNYSFEMDQEWRSRIVPSFVLQPLVENCIKHGISGKLESGLIEIKIVKRNDLYFLSVKDDGLGFSPLVLKNPFNTKGHGLNNVNERWQIFSGNGIQIQSSEDQGTEILMEFTKMALKQN